MVHWVIDPCHSRKAVAPLTRRPHGFGVRPNAGGYVLVLLSDFPWHIEARTHEVDGVPQLTGLRIEWFPMTADAVITSDRLRRLPLRELVETAAGIQAGNLGRAAAAMRNSEIWPQGRARPDEHFAEVAAIYREAIQNRRPPLNDIRARWTVSRAMASKYVKRARELGYLGPAKTGVAGEVATPRRKAGK
jgi:hypothetical protein